MNKEHKYLIKIFLIKNLGGYVLDAHHLRLSLDLKICCKKVLIQIQTVLRINFYKSQLNLRRTFRMYRLIVKVA